MTIGKFTGGTARLIVGTWTPEAASKGTDSSAESMVKDGAIGGIGGDGGAGGENGGKGGEGGWGGGVGRHE